MTEETQPDLALRGAGLSATGTTADELSVGEGREGTTYDDPGGPGTAYRETTSGDPQADLGQPSDDPSADGPREPGDGGSA